MSDTSEGQLNRLAPIATELLKSLESQRRRNYMKIRFSTWTLMATTTVAAVVLAGYLCFRQAFL